MLDDELKHEGLIIDEKEAKRQFLEELRNKNMQEDKKKEVNNSDDDISAENSKVVSNEESSVKQEINEMPNEELKSKEEIASSKDTESNKETVDEEEIINEEPKNEEVVNEEDTTELEEPKDEEINKDEILESAASVSEDSDPSSKEKKSFLSSAFKTSLIDTAVTALASFVGVYLFNLILRLFGYQVIDFKGVYIIIFLIILVLYPVIMQKSKYGKTLGQKFCKI